MSHGLDENLRIADPRRQKRWGLDRYYLLDARGVTDKDVDIEKGDSRATMRSVQLDGLSVEAPKRALCKKFRLIVESRRPVLIAVLRLPPVWPRPRRNQMGPGPRARELPCLVPGLRDSALPGRVALLQQTLASAVS
jgi:hypothetical protein